MLQVKRREQKTTAVLLFFSLLFVFASLLSPLFPPRSPRRHSACTPTSRRPRVECNQE